MRRTILLAGLLAGLVSHSAASAPLEPTTCGQRYTQHDYRHYAKRVFARRTIRRPARERLALMRSCQHSPKARANVRRFTKHLARARWRRLHYWTWQHSRLTGATRAMLARLRGCETHGIPYPRNYRWDGHHDGAYQYDAATWHDAGGSGFAYQASPAEQDVRTAWFYPSHRGQWECRA